MRTILLLTLLVICALACKKSEPIQPGLFGKWEIHRRYGSIAGFDSTYKAGNGTVMQFNSDSTYKYYVKNKLSSTGTFHVQTIIGIASSSSTIYFNNNTSGEPLSYSGNKMTIGADYDDDVAADYIKIAN
ncbi:MAG TPA: hypothetical protein VL442_08350 [Mucilaginibacter sp.]|nr:hypothetical protein [Mucilaginibacter sp.]